MDENFTAAHEPSTASGRPRPSRWERVHAAPAESEAPKAKRPYTDLFLISFTILFLELACIRWFASTVIFLTFFTNLVLMACFLGMSVGCLAASRKKNLVATTVPIALVAVTLSSLLLWAYTKYGKVLIDVGGQGTPQQIYFGTEYVPKDPSHFVLPIELLAGVFFTLIALMFVGLGQVMGRSFAAIPNRVGAYTTNIVGSLIGIGAFGLASYLQFSPYIWFAAGLFLTLYFVPRRSLWQLGAQMGLLMAVALVGQWESNTYQVQWSPYYKIGFWPAGRMINTNNIGHQQMLPFGETAPAYSLPHLLNRDSGGAPFEDVLVIGAGSGNDVQTALAYGAKHVDAVEIDPVIQSLGATHHPNQPYSDPRVTVHLDDGRSFVRKTEKKYDLIVYALVDSLVLHSGYSSLRLESFLFTEQAFRDIKAKLKPGGVFAMYNYYRQGWVVGRLDKMARKVFLAKPVVVPLPYKDKLAMDDNWRGITCLLAGGKGRLAPIHAAMGPDRFFWVHNRPIHNLSVNGFGPEPPKIPGVPDQWLKIGPAEIESAKVGRVPSDNWPFLYLRDRAIPGLNLRGMAIVAVLSVVILLAFMPVKTVRPSGRMFFLGAGFMLLETKGVVHMALLFGSTWVVNSIVFAAILAMILLSNLFVLGFKPKSMKPYYAGLVAALLVNTFVPTEYFLSLPGLTRLVASCAVTFVPIFFAGVVFATALKKSDRPDVDLGSNVLGAILGGLSENLALAVGFESLMLVAIGFYALSAVLVPRLRVNPMPAMA